MSVRATILETGNPLLVGAEITINAPARKIFDLLANPERHPDFDGSGTVRRSLRGPKRLYLGAKFGMAMKVKLQYRITNEVVAFEEDSVIAWRHLMRWVWRYELTAIDAQSTLVREYFDGNPARSKKWLEITGALARNPKLIAKSLVRLKALAERS
ncbi:MAG: SRPBCC family protein [Actinomycetota bacterium]